jgi:hypothetical protein
LRDLTAAGKGAGGEHEHSQGVAAHANLLEA